MDQFWVVEPVGPQVFRMGSDRPTLVYYRFRWAAVRPAGVPVLGLADAQVNLARGVVIASTPSVARYSPSGGGPSLSGIYHSYDIPFYYFDLRANAADRAAHFAATK